MSEYPGQNNYWNPPPPQSQYNFEDPGFGNTEQQFEFHNYNQQVNDPYQYSQKPYLEPTQNSYGGNIYGGSEFGQGSANYGEEDEEPPLLEELGIDPDRIIQKTMAVMNPFHRRSQTDDASYLSQDSDLVGPFVFCVLLELFLFLSASKAHFGSVYGLSATSCVLMYILLSLMSSSETVTLASVASILGYCILPVVTLAGISVFFSLKGTFGFAIAAFAVTWASVSASRLFCTMSGDEKQRLLVAYPCVLLYGVFTLIVIF